MQTRRTLTLADTRGRVQSLYRLSSVIGALKFVDDGVLVGNSEKLIAQHFATIGQMFAGRPGLAHGRIREAVECQGRGPSDDWCAWFQGIVTARDFDDKAVQAIGAELDPELANFAQVLRGLPPQVRWRLGPGFDLKQRPWVVGVRLRGPRLAAELDDAFRAEVEAAGGPTRYVRTLVRWRELIPLLQARIWSVDWPDASSIIQRLDEILDLIEERKQTAFYVNPRLVRLAILRILRREHPAWLPRGGESIEPQLQKKLLASILNPPGHLSTDGLPSSVQAELAPLEVPGKLVNKVLEQLLDEGKWLGTCRISYKARGALNPHEGVYYYRGREVGLTEGSARQVDSSLDQVCSSSRSEAVGAAVPEYVLCRDDVAILNVLKKSGHSLIQVDIEAALGGTAHPLQIRTIRKHLKELRDAQMVHRPHGVKGGEAITHLGREALDKTTSR